MDKRSEQSPVFRYFSPYNVILAVTLVVLEWQYFPPVKIADIRLVGQRE